MRVMCNPFLRWLSAIGTKGPQDLQDEIFDELYVSTVGGEDPAPFTNYMMKLPKTPRAKEKALEKEIPWSIIPEEQREGFRSAERTQYDEHLQHGALEPLTVEASREVQRTKPERVPRKQIRLPRQVLVQKEGAAGDWLEAQSPSGHCRTP